MIKFTGKSKANRTIIGFGLSDMNLQKLKQGQPIYFFGEEVGVPGTDFTILYGKTEKDLESMLKKKTDPQDAA